MKCEPLVINCQVVVGAINYGAQVVVGKKQRKDRIVCAGGFVNRQAICRYGIPKPEELDARNFPFSYFLVLGEQFAYGAEWCEQGSG